MLTVWEKIFIDNRYNIDFWERKFRDNISKTTRTAVSYDLTRMTVSGVTVTVALFIISSGNGIFFIENNTNISAITALIVTFPRQIQIIQNIFAFFNSILK
ncbi:hypothetical protein [Fluviispira vulneris]|uniref:hypothetical protein n=1 Tax=Fluviispira vulneris TaxID=2763012 RepID=UPI001646A9CF|nr:hypothetical protein [Fluviispira vulneris]